MENRFARTNACAESVHRQEKVLRDEPSHLFVIDRTIGIHINHHGCDEPIPN
jgi:hypothetical protein